MGGDGRQFSGGQIGLLRHLQPAHDLFHRAAENGLGRFRVGVDVEFRRRGAVAAGGRATHEDDAAQVAGQLRVLAQGDGDVGQRPKGN